MKTTPLTHYRGYAISAIRNGGWEYFSELDKRCHQTATLEDAKKAIRVETRKIDQIAAEQKLNTRP